MRIQEYVKKYARKFGIYKVVRDIWRMISPEVRAQISTDLILYGRFISAGDLVFDVGANLGQKSEIFLKLGATVAAVEPNPKSRKVLEAQFDHLGKFFIAPFAVGAYASMATLSFKETSSTASLRPDWNGLEWGDGDLEQAVVEVVTLDFLIAQYGTPMFCKIDVEGFELEVIQGLSKPIEQLSFEFHSDESERISQIFKLLGNLDDYKFNIIAMNDEAFLLKEWRDISEFPAALGGADLPTVGDIFVSRVS